VLEAAVTVGAKGSTEAKEYSQLRVRSSSVGRRGRGYRTSGGEQERNCSAADRGRDTAEGPTFLFCNLAIFLFHFHKYITLNFIFKNRS
jgi:hypothetical protein